MIDERPDCRPALDWLQRRLDGDAREPPSDIGEHVAICSDCRERIRAAELFLTAFADRTHPLPLATERTLAAVRSDIGMRRQQRWTASAAALAAGIMLAFWLWPRSPAEPTFIVQRDEPKSQPERLPSLEAFGDAFVAATRRAAADTVEPGRLLLPDIDLPAVPTIAMAPDLSPLESARQGLVDGFEPVATSAKRAVNMLLRDLTADDKKGR